jgi:MFS family permease
VRADAAEADRRREVRVAARGWRRAGAIDDHTLAALVTSYPDDRVRLGPSFRGLAFVFTALALNAVFFFVMAVLRPDGHTAGASAMAFGLLLCVLADIQFGPLRREEGGLETATALVGLAYLLGGAGLLMSDARWGERTLLSWLFAMATLAFAAAAWRWGMRVCAALAGVSFFLLLTQGPVPRLLWIVASAMSIPPLTAAGEYPRLPPAHRRSVQALLGLALIALYAAAHLSSWDTGFIESMSSGAHGLKDSPLRPLAIAGTALIPLAAIAFGVVTRRRLFLDVGLALGIVSLVTLRFYVHLAPLWVVLTVGGGVAIAAALALRRFLASGAGGERGGLTAEPLFEDPEKHRSLAVVAALAASPAAKVTASDDRSLAPGGGRFGGGGASGEY